MEAWSRMTDVAATSTKAIIDDYNAKNTKGNKVTFVYIPQTQGSQADEKLLTAVAGGTSPGLPTTPIASRCRSSPTRGSSRISPTPPRRQA